ncbi:MAG: NUDIX hydrolase [bacterium]|nr:NUDIX hydrolase [bacterium]
MDGTLRNMASVYLSKGERMLLLFRQGGRVVNNVWVGSAGGHFEPFELNDARACVLRECEEELGIGEDAMENLSLRYVTLRRAKGEIRQNYYFFADLKKDVDERLTSNEGISKWFAYPELSALEMPYTSKFVIEHYLKIGRMTDQIYVGAADGETLIFTELPEC